MALSTAEAEYAAACSTSCEAVWMRKLLSNLFDLQLDATCIYCDNHSCLKLSKNPVFHDKSKHINIQYHYIKDMVQRGAVKLEYVATDEHIANVLTKPLARLKFEYSISSFPQKGSDLSVSHSNIVRGLVPSMVRCKG